MKGDCMNRLLIIVMLLSCLSVHAQTIPSKMSKAGWTKMTATALNGGPENSTYCPASPNYGGCTAIYNAWGGAAMDTLRNRLIIWGGGHADYSGNEVYSIDLASNPPTMQRLDPLSANTNMSCPAPEALADGRPNSRHTYDENAYLPDQDEFFSVGGATGYCGYAASAGTWTLQMSSVVDSCAPTCSSNWTFQGNENFVNSYGILTAYDTVRHLLWGMDETTLRSFNPATNTWTTVASGGFNLGPNSGTAVYDPYDQYFIVVGHDSTGGGHSIQYISTASGSSYTLVEPTIDSSCSALDNSFNGSAWDPIERAVVTYNSSGNSVYVINPHTWLCYTDSYGSTKGVDYPQDQNAQGTGIISRFNYNPTFDVFTVCNDPENDCWYLRRRR